MAAPPLPPALAARLESGAGAPAFRAAVASAPGEFLLAGPEGTPRALSAELRRNLPAGGAATLLEAAARQEEAGEEESLWLLPERQGGRRVVRLDCRRLETAEGPWTLLWLRPAGRAAAVAEDLRAWLVVDRQDRRIRSARGPLLRELGYASAELRGRLVFSLYHPSVREGLEAAFARLCLRGAVREVSLRVVDACGEVHEVLLDEELLRNPRGEVVGSLCTWRARRLPAVLPGG